MPIPISQNLQLAGQSDVTPWELPYEPMFAALANQQKTFNDNLDNLAKIPELVPKGGVHTTDIRNNLLNEINADLDTARAGMSETGKLDPMIIPRLKAKLTSDPRLQELELDEKYITPNSLKNRYEGELDNSAHNVLDKNGNWTQLGKGVESLSEIGFIKNEDYMNYLTTQIKGVVTKDIKNIADIINTNFKTRKTADGTVIGNVVRVEYGPTGEPYLVTTKDEFSGEVESLTKSYLKERLLTASDENGISLAEAWFNNETNPINFFKKKEKFEGRGNTYEDFVNRAISPLVQGLQYTHRSTKTTTSKIATPLSDGGAGGSGGSGETPYIPEELALTGLDVLYGIDSYQQFQKDMLENFDWNVGEVPTVEGMHKAVMNSEVVVENQINTNSKLAQTATEKIKKDIPELKNINFSSLFSVGENGFIDLNTGADFIQDLEDAKTKRDKDQNVVIDDNYVDNTIAKITNWLDVNGEDVQGANSKLAIIKASQENLISMRENLHSFAGVDTEALKKKEDKFFNEVPTDKTIIQVSGNDKSRMFSLQLRNSKLTAQEVKDGDYILSPITKELISSSNTVEFNKTIEENAIRRFVLAKGFIKSPGDAYKWRQLSETEKDEYREEVYSNGKKRLKDYLSEYESKASEAIYGDMEQSEKDYIEATLKMQSEFQVTTGTVFFMNDITRNHKPSDYTTAEKHIENLNKGTFQLIQNMTDLANVKWRFGNNTIGDDVNATAHFNALQKNATFEVKTNTESGDTKTQLTYKVNGKDMTADVGFRVDLGEFNEDGTPKIMMDLHLNGLPIDKTRKKVASEKYGVQSDVALQVVEIPMDMNSDLGKYIQKALYASDENYREVYTNKRYVKIKEDLVKTGQTKLSLFQDDINPANDINISWQHVAGKGSGKTEYKGKFSMGGLYQEDIILTANSALQIRDLENSINAIATSPETVRALMDNPSGPAKQDILAHMATVLFSKPVSSLNDGQIKTANKIVDTLVKNFPTLSMGINEETFFYIQEQDRISLTEIHNSLIPQEVSDMLFIQPTVSQPIIQRDVIEDYTKLITTTSSIIDSLGLEGYKVSIESAWRSIENQDRLIAQDKSGVKNTGAVSNSGHLSARSIDFTIKSEKNGKLSKQETQDIAKQLKELGFDVIVHGDDYHVHVNLKVK